MGESRGSRRKSGWGRGEGEATLGIPEDLLRLVVPPWSWSFSSASA